MNQIKDIQEENVDNTDSYMVGLYNGMEFMVSIAEDREPLFKFVARDNKEDHVTEQLTMQLIEDPVSDEVVKQIQNKYFG